MGRPNFDDGTPLWAHASGTGGHEPCPACQRVHGGHLVRLLSISGPAVHSASRSTYAPESQYREPSAVPVLAPEGMGEGFLPSRWSVALA